MKGILRKRWRARRSRQASELSCALEGRLAYGDRRAAAAIIKAFREMRSETANTVTVEFIPIYWIGTNIAIDR